MPAIGSVHKARITYRDVSDETSAVEVYNGPITALTIAGFLSQFGDFQTATDAITLGVRAKQQWIGDDTVVSNARPTDPAAHREAKLLVQYMDDTTEEKYTLTVPTIDFSVLNFVPGGGDAVIFQGGGESAEIAAWVTAFEALARAPRTGNAVVVTGMRFVGRNT